MTDIVRQEIAATAHTVVIKIGTRPLTADDGTLDEARISRLAGEISDLCEAGRRVALVSSGAVAAGLGQLGLGRRPNDLPTLQAAAAIGQSYLLQTYERALRKHGRHAAQILLTTNDFDDRKGYLNIRNTLAALFDLGAVPIINENDTVSVEELQTTFGDNDHLAALVTTALRAPLLVILSDVEGLYDRDPTDRDAQVIPMVSVLDEEVFGLVADRPSEVGKGGMRSKLEAVRIATAAGENVVIASGRRRGVLADLFAGQNVGTLFLAQGPLVSTRKRWIGFSVRPRGHLVLDDGARQAIESGGGSLLPIGVVDVVGRFGQGDVVALRDGQGDEFARGLSNYTADEVKKIKGHRSEQITELLGHCPYHEVIHRDNLIVTSPEVRSD